MPVEIRELVIRAVTTMEQEDTAEPETESLRLTQDSTEGTEAIIQECVRKVLHILRREKER